MKTAKSSGDQGETWVAEYLERRGCTVLGRQWRCRYGELDLIAWDGGVVCFVEVKRRGPRSLGLPREFVDGRKQERLKKAAAAYLAEGELDALARFDVAEVYEEGNGRLHIEYLENAFE